MALLLIDKNQKELLDIALPGRVSPSFELSKIVVGSTVMNRVEMRDMINACERCIDTLNLVIKEYERDSGKNADYIKAANDKISGLLKILKLFRNKT